MEIAASYIECLKMISIIVVSGYISLSTTLKWSLQICQHEASFKQMSVVPFLLCFFVCLFVFFFVCVFWLAYILRRVVRWQQNAQPKIAEIFG